MSDTKTATVDEKFKAVWALFEDDKLGEARAAAAELLRDPHLGPFHQAGMRLIMMMAPSPGMHQHLFEAFRLFTDKNANSMSVAEKEEIRRLMEHAQKIANGWFHREVQKKLDNGWTTGQLQDLEKKARDKYVKGEKIPGVVYYDDEVLPGSVNYTSKDS
ncbi:hypothetical protein FPOA_09496 [Fusarium poae]|uniref:Uncharacterized protein n=1 Tax=Fusarium poae TaxID=36050 RepID=A0A1B8ABC4_FUSPO|nr:hypothetical protein FPOA_09496 [Fusarium poae]